ncbi:NAD(P)H-dependent oxidoreductase subunit E [Candidatus Dependentiae bacterium]|nr:NAD(P)H-dependent oxidoreductase subunit E [Candidatus Dependentiae bacterium]
MEAAALIAVIDNSVKNDSGLIPILEDVQNNFGYILEEAVQIISKKINRPASEIYGVATFYKSFSLTPRGKHLITVCVGTACHVRGGSKIVDALSRELKIDPGETTEDLNYSLEAVNCLGCCAIGPVIVVDDEYYGEMTTQKALNLVSKLKKEDEND